MAMFDTHLAIGTTLSGALAAVVATTSTVTTGMALGLVVAGAVGSVLPDLDSPTSRPTRVTYSLLSMTLALLFCVEVAGGVPLWSMPVIYASIFLSSRMLLARIFEAFSTHRGMVHSLPAAVLAALLVVNGAHFGLAVDITLSWWLGIFVLWGFLVHLLLDEVYAVNIAGVRFKRSFGSAVKLWGQMVPTVLCYAAVLVLWLLAPAVPKEILAMAGW
ncbi:metal-dependent hydrolase [Desulfurispira natronophila]|uniref:Membrane-bound metal-dependent hydrolase n=1 Tax=Desulfurispira natronophila TaxID=682562 RepID=A0A7W7Y495_9BACT|nr:metal-dependent hydrolase [Desulfurispira natronophila]MBB5021800.1 hypothetical protein [Desulfurispira natronophila]